MDTKRSLRARVPRLGLPRRAALGAWCLLVLVAGTVRAVTSGGGDDGGPRQTVGGVELSGAETRFGTSPETGDDVEYQPDVVVIDDGASAVVSVSGDGTTWTLDGSASGVDDLEVGDVVHATSQATGRVVKIDERGDDVAVTLAPVDLTEVIRNADLTFEQPLDTDPSAGQLIPRPIGGAVVPLTRTEDEDEDEDEDEEDDGGASTDGDDGQGADPSEDKPGGDEPADDEDGADELLPPDIELEFEEEIPVEDYDVSLSKSARRLGVRVTTRDGDSLKLDLGLDLRHRGLTLQSTLMVCDGQLVGSVRLRGLEGVDIDIDAGTAEGLADNRAVKVEVPYELNIPVKAAGMPVNLRASVAFIARIGFSAKNSTLSASGSYKLFGSAGFDVREPGAPVLATPTLAREKSLLESMSGISLGVAGLVVAFDWKWSIGLGVPQAMGGAHLRTTFSVALTAGSDLGFVKCYSAQLDADLSVGLGLSVSQLREDHFGRFRVDAGLPPTPLPPTTYSESMASLSGHKPAAKVCSF